MVREAEAEAAFAVAPPSSDFSTIILQRSGGVGKTNLTRILMLLLNFAGIRPQLVSIDSVGKSQSKLAEVEPDVLDLRFSADLKEMQRNPNITAGLFDPLMDLWRERDNVLLDGGANTADLLFDWAANRRVSKLLQDRKINFLVPTTTDFKALDEARNVLERIAGGSIPVGKVTVAVVEVKGTLKEASGAEKAALVAYCAAHDVPIFAVPCNYYMDFAEKDKLRYLDFWNMTAYDYVEFVASHSDRIITVGRAGTTGLKFEEMVSAVGRALMDIGMAPQIEIPEKPIADPMKPIVV